MYRGDSMEKNNNFDFDLLVNDTSCRDYDEDDCYSFHSNNDYEDDDFFEITD